MELEGAERALSAESIYRHVYSPAGALACLACSAQRKPKRGRRRRNGRREPAIPNRTPIHQRPTKAHLRSQFGHCEGDLMHFRRQRDILLTLQERKTRLTLDRRLSGKDADSTDSTARAIIDELAGLPATARRTITCDNGGEFARHQDISGQIGLRAYFCDPHSPWQRSGDRERQWTPAPRPAPQVQSRRIIPPPTSMTSSGTSTQRRESALVTKTPIEAFAANLGVALVL
ncbi:MAG: IS30 family transposase [Candidatus Binatia bacterium]